MNTVYAPSALALPEPPGARTARVCGTLAIVFAVTCVGIPVAVILAVVALVKHNKAKSLACQSPGDYAVPTSSGLVLGIIGLVMPLFMLPVAGIVSAVAIPAILGQRARAEEKALRLALNDQVEMLARAYELGREKGMDLVAVQEDLERTLQEGRSAYLRKAPQPSLRTTLTLLAAGGREEVQSRAETEALEQGQMVFAAFLPSEGNSKGYLTGAAPLKRSMDGGKVVSKTVVLN